MLTGTVEVLDLNIKDDGQVVSTTERFSLPLRGSIPRVRFDAVKCPNKWLKMGDGLLCAEPHPGWTKERAQTVLDRIGDGEFAYHDSAHPGGMILVLLLPNSWTISRVDDLDPKPFRAKQWKGRLAVLWNLSAEEATVRWKQVKSTGPDLSEVVASLNRQGVVRPQQQGELQVEQPVEVEQPTTQIGPGKLEKGIAYFLVVAIVLMVLFVAGFQSNIQARNFALLRIVLSVAMAVIGGVVSGSIRVKVGWQRVSVRAGGAAAFFVVTYFFTPTVIPQEDTTTERPSGNGQRPEKDERDLPLAKLENFKGSSLTHRGGTTYMSGPWFTVLNAQDDEPKFAYPVVSFELAKVAKHDTIRVNSVQVTSQVVERQLRLVTETTVTNFKPPITYFAKLSRKKNSTNAELKINGQITDGLITFTEADPIAKCRLEFDGEPGLYLVSVTVQVQEVRGDRKETLRSLTPIFINIGERNEE
jgi:hypothetical protein